MDDGVRRTAYRYDALGRRIGKSSRAVSLSGIRGDGLPAEETRFIWEGLRLLQEQPGKGQSRTYQYDPERAYAPLARIDHARNSGQGEVYHYHTDPNGTAREVIDEDGQQVWSGSYSAWGQVRANIASAIGFSQPLRMPGQYHDEESGLSYNTFRYYDPHGGRFVSSDPVGLAGGLNLYQYAPNPVRWIDPLGLMCGEIGPTRKNGGSLTEPQLPPKTIVKENGVEIVHYTRSGDHGPAHLHVKGGRAETKIGQSGKPIEGAPELTSIQRGVVENNQATIRRAIDKMQRWSVLTKSKEIDYEC